MTGGASAHVQPAQNRMPSPEVWEMWKRYEKIGKVKTCKDSKKVRFWKDGLNTQTSIKNPKEVQPNNQPTKPRTPPPQKKHTPTNQTKSNKQIHRPKALAAQAAGSLRLMAAGDPAAQMMHPTGMAVAASTPVPRGLEREKWHRCFKMVFWFDVF